MADYYLIVDTLRGESRDEKMGAQGAADIDNFAWGCANAGHWHEGAGGGMSKSTFQDFMVTKKVCSMTPGLMRAVATGKHFARVQVVCRKAGGDQMNYLTFDFQDVLVTSLETSGMGDYPVERLTFNFASFKLNYVKQSKTGGADSPQGFSYDIAARKVA